MVCDKAVCEVMYVTDGMWQSCVLSLRVWSYCMWKMVCDKVVCVCEVMYVTDGMWQSCVLSLCVWSMVWWQSCMLSLCVCEVIVCERWCVTGGRRREEGGGRRERPGIQNQKQEPHTKLWGTKQFCETSAKSGSSQLQNDTCRQDFFKIRSLQDQKRSNSARHPSKNEKLSAELTASCQCGLWFCCSCVRSIAPATEKQPGHTKCCTCHTESC